MGQRLNIEITHNGKCLANCYYHWSGYSSSAARLIDIIVNSYFDKEEEYINTDFTSFDIFAVELLESTGARLDKRELERYKNIITTKNATPEIVESLVFRKIL